MTRFELEPAAEPGRYTVRVDGHDISTAVRAVELGTDIDDTGHAVAYVTLVLQPGLDARAGAQYAKLRVDGDTAVALTALGWTPPAGKGGGKP